MKTHLESKFECEKCENVYTRKDNLQKHQLSCGGDIVRVKKNRSDDIQQWNMWKNVHTKKIPHTNGEAILAAVVQFNSDNLGSVL